MGLECFEAQQFVQFGLLTLLVCSPLIVVIHVYCSNSVFVSFSRNFDSVEFITVLLLMFLVEC
jgi:hypothetical protein